MESSVGYIICRFFRTKHAEIADRHSSRMYANLLEKLKWFSIESYRFLLASSHLRMHFCLYRWVHRPLVISQYNRWNKCAEIPEAYLTAIRQDRADEQAAGEYNYDEQGDDWTGTCQSGENQSPIDLIFEDVSFRRVIYFKVLLTFYLNSRKLWPFPVCVSTTMISHCKPPWWLPIMATQVGSYQIT